MASRVELAAAFERWLRRWQEDPGAFQDLASCEPGDYGERAAEHLIRMLAEED